MPLAASDYPLLDLFWTTAHHLRLDPVVLAAHPGLLRCVPAPGHRRRGEDRVGVFVIVLPFIGVLVYLISQGRVDGRSGPWRSMQ